MSRHLIIAVGDGSTDSATIRAAMPGQLTVGTSQPQRHRRFRALAERS
jgi:soluble P-type ATPase